MPLPRLACLALLALAACATAPQVPPVPAATPAAAPANAPSPQGAEPRAEDTYGLVPENPVRVGGGPSGERAYLSALRGPRGEPVRFQRLGSCCAFETPHGFNGRGLLDQYEVTYDGLEAPVVLYLDMYDAQAVRAPPGFRLEDAAAPEAPRKTLEL